MRFTKTWYTGHPRTVFREEDWPAIIARTNGGSSWRTRWENYWLQHAAAMESGSTVEQIATDWYDNHTKTLLLALAGVIEGNASYRQKATDVAKSIAQNHLGSLDSMTKRRNGMYAMAWAYDVLYRENEMTSGNKTIIRTGIVTLANTLDNLSSQEGLTGHSGGNSIALAVGAAAIQEEDPTNGDADMNTALDFQWGASADGTGRIYRERHFCADGGNTDGTSYTMLTMASTFRMLHLIHNAFVRNVDTPGSLQLDGADYEPWTDEAWVVKVPLWYLHMMRGNDDYVTISDTSRIGAPWFDENWRMCLATLVERGGSFRGVMRWLYERLHQKDVGIGFGTTSNDYTIQELFLFDPADPNNASQTPEVANVSRSRFFVQPGHYASCLPLFEPRDNVVTHIEAGDEYFHGHNHLKSGGIQMAMKNESILLNSGTYQVYQDDHSNNWRQQSISCSGVVLVEGQSSDGSDETYNRDDDGVRQAYKNGLGGQCWMTDDGTIDGQFGPYNANELQTDGGGLMWKRGDRKSMDHSDSNYDFITIDCRRAYLKVYTDYNGSAERVRKMHHKILVIKDVHPWPVIFRVVHVESRLASFKKRDHWHFFQQPALDGVTGRYKGFGMNSTGFCVVAYHNAASYTYEIIGGGTQTDGYGENDFRWPYPGGTNWRPTTGLGNTRHAPDIGHYRLEVSPSVATTEDWFACLLIPGEAGDVLPTYEWFEEPDYFGVRFGAGGTQQYRIHKTEWLAIRGEQDSTAPAVPLNPSAVPGPNSGEVTVDCDKNVDDTTLYNWYKREKPT